MSIAAQQFHITELDEALANTAHHIHQLIALHRVVSHANATHLLGLELPREQVYLDALHQLAAKQRELRAHLTTQGSNES